MFSEHRHPAAVEVLSLRLALEPSKETGAVLGEEDRYHGGPVKWDLCFAD